MSMELHSLNNDFNRRKKSKRVGRGPGSGIGKTCGRGIKGAGARSGYKRRFGYEGGQFRLYMKLPTRGFSRARFRKRFDSINLYQIDQLYNDNEVVNLESLSKHGYLSSNSYGIKILGEGELTKKVTIEATAISHAAAEKLKKQGIKFYSK